MKAHWYSGIRERQDFVSRCALVLRGQGCQARVVGPATMEVGGVVVELREGQDRVIAVWRVYRDTGVVDVVDLMEAL